MKVKTFIIIYVLIVVIAWGVMNRIIYKDAKRDDVADFSVLESGQNITAVKQEPWTGVPWEPTTSLMFGSDDEGSEIGVLDWSTGKLEFSGKMSCSARSFFKYFLKPYVDEYIAGLSYEEARELEWEFPTASRTFMFRNMTWPITQTLSIREFIEWLYDNDYKIVKNEEEEK